MTTLKHAAPWVTAAILLVAAALAAGYFLDRRPVVTEFSAPAPYRYRRDSAMGTCVAIDNATNKAVAVVDCSATDPALIDDKLQ